MKVVFLNDWSTLRKYSVGVHWITLFTLSAGRIDLGDYKIRFSLMVIGLGFQIQQWNKQRTKELDQ